jgi:DNA helicase-2/ATP-dependent DNA helicase PcrA
LAEDTLPKKARAGLQNFYYALKQSQELVGQVDLGQLASDVLDRTGYRSFWQAEVKKFEAKRKAVDAEKAAQRLANVEEVVSAVVAYADRVKEPSLQGYLEEVALLAAQDKLEGGKVSLMTIHASKGLEFDGVWLVGAEKGLLPGLRAVTDAEKAEELRLTFVACSRPRRWLTVSYCDTRMLYGRTERREPSPFLDLLPVEASTWHERDRQMAALALSEDRAQSAV